MRLSSKVTLTLFQGCLFDNNTNILLVVDAKMLFYQSEERVWPVDFMWVLSLCHRKSDWLCNWMCWTGDPLYIVKIVIGPIICFILLLLVSVTGFVMFKKKYASVALIFFLFLNSAHSQVKSVFLLFLSVKLKVLVVPSMPHPTQSIWVLMMVRGKKNWFNHLHCVFINRFLVVNLN